MKCQQKIKKDSKISTNTQKAETSDNSDNDDQIGVMVMKITYFANVALTNWLTEKPQISNYTASQKNIPNIFDCNVKKDYRILIISGMNVPGTTCRQVTI